jgi:hypothetical protein
MDHANRTTSGLDDPEHPIDARQNRSPTFSVEGRELPLESSILDRNGYVTAHQESDESEEQQEEAWYGYRLFALIPLRVKL